MFYTVSIAAKLQVYSLLNCEVASLSNVDQRMALSAVLPLPALGERTEESFKYISEKYLNELFNHRDEYREMFQEYFKVRTVYLQFILQLILALSKLEWLLLF